MTKKKAPKTDQDVSSEVNKFNLLLAVPELVSKYGKGTIIFSVVIVFLVVNLVINPINFEKILDKWTAKTELEHRLGLEKRMRANIEIPSILRDLLYEVGADRIMILELHNGGSNKSNLPFFHFDAKYEVINKAEKEDGSRVQSVSHKYKDEDTGDYGSMLEDLANIKCIYYDNIDSITYSRFIWELKENGIKSIHLNPIFSNDGEIVAVLSIASSIPNSLDHNRIQQLTMVASQKIGSLLSGISNTKNNDETAW